jgi:hypothetical protein
MEFVLIFHALRLLEHHVIERQFRRVFDLLHGESRETSRISILAIMRL